MIAKDFRSKIAVAGLEIEDQYSCLIKGPWYHSILAFFAFLSHSCSATSLALFYQSFDPCASIVDLDRLKSCLWFPQIQHSTPVQFSLLHIFAKVTDSSSRSHPIVSQTLQVNSPPIQTPIHVTGSFISLLNIAQHTQLSTLRFGTI